MIQKLRLIIGSAAVLISIFLLFYGGDNEYLQQRTADKMWLEYLDSTGELFRKGDHLYYDPVPLQSEEGRWNSYRDRIATQVALLNARNAPIMRNSYKLQTDLHDLDGKHSITFNLYENSTGQILESREITSESIRAKSMVPALLAIVFALITLKPALSLLVAVWIGSTINNANSPIVGIYQMMVNYIPSGIAGKGLFSLKIILSFLLMQASLSMLRRSSCSKNMRDIDSVALKLLPFPFMALHPYMFSGTGSWWIGLFTSRQGKPYRSSFISHSMALLLPALIFSPYMVYAASQIGGQLSLANLIYSPWELFTGTFPFRFFSFSMLAVIAGYLIFNKDIGCISKDAEDPSSLYGDYKPMMRINRWLPYAAVILSAAALLLSGIYTQDVTTSLLIASLVLFTVVSTVLIRGYLLNVKESALVILSSLRENASYAALLVLSFAMAKVMADLGTVYYVASIFKVGAGSTTLPLAAFLMSTIMTVLMGNSLAALSLLTPLLVPVAAQMGAGAELMMTIAGLIEGGLAGEMLSPFSPTSIIVSGTYGIPTAKHSLTQLPYAAMMLVSAAILGFLMTATEIHAWVSYCAISAFGLIVMFKKPKNIK